VLPAWADWLQKQGYVAFIVDSFSGRGLSRICFDSRPLFPDTRSFDVFAAATYLKSLPFVQADRIGAIGWSHGGSTVIWAGVNQRQFRNIRLAALVAFYPGCGPMSRYPGGTPLLLLLGGKDDWTPPGQCQVRAQEAQARGLPIFHFVYPNAHHGFDNVRLPIEGLFIPGVNRGRGATVAYDPEAREDSEVQVKRFLEAHLRR
jgi:dienelactone hydrolase